MDSPKARKIYLYTTDPTLIPRLKQYGKKENRTPSNVTVLAIREFLDRHAPVKPKAKKHK